MTTYRRPIQTVLFGLSTFALGALLFSASPAVGQSLCATVPATSAATLAPTMAANPIITRHKGTMSDPVPLGATMGIYWSYQDGTKTDFTLQIVQVLRGKDLEKAAGPALGGTPLPDGQEHLGVLLEGVIQSNTGNNPLVLNGSEFHSFSDHQLLNGDLFSPTPMPYLSLQGFPGAKIKGWVTVTVFTDDPTPMIILGNANDNGPDGLYFLTH